MWYHQFQIQKHKEESLAKIKAVTLDLWGTLYPYPVNRNRTREVQGQLGRLGYETGLEEVSEAVSFTDQTVETLSKSDLLFAREKKHHSQVYYLRWYRHLLEYLEIKPGNLDRFLLRMFEEYYFDPEFKLHPQVAPLLSFLRRRDLRTGLITNSTPRVREILVRDHILEFFDTIRISGEIGWEKPHPNIFHITLARIGVRAAETIHVGDSLEDDYQASKKVGMRPILIDWRRQNMSVEEITVIPELFELKHFV